MRRLKWGWVVLGGSMLVRCMLPVSAVAARPYRFQSLFLYQPDRILEERHADLEELTLFMAAISQRAAKLVPQIAKEARDGLLVVAVYPGKKLSLWLDLDGQTAPVLTRSLTLQVADVAVPGVVNGPVACALRFALWGGAGKDADEEEMLPQAWRDVMRRSGQPRYVTIPDGVLRLLGDPAALSGVPQPAMQTVKSGAVPVLYNHIRNVRDPMHRTIAEALAPAFKVLSVNEPDREFVVSKVTKRKRPEPVHNEKGDPIQGEVLTICAVSADGSLLTIHVAGDVDKRLAETAVRALKEWQFEPARLDGRPVASTLAHRFNFK